VTRLLDQFGFDTVDAGPLKEGWRIQRDTPGYGTNRHSAYIRNRYAIFTKNCRPSLINSFCVRRMLLFRSTISAGFMF
jgi:hypothetical protein